MSSSIDKGSDAVREVPIAAPADRAEYRRYRLDQVQRELPPNAGKDLRKWISDIESKRLAQEQGEG
ncbi:MULTISPECIES: hypothetical protein [Amycolatopsis]|uniref:Uncharacterized protein n=1 Tax=Amycolatopsis tucumanensis TaxID=401106 RepID=A0ABP7JFB8_9PSEU|nr:hypothetical protein [Amycolatopsis tucumanensis]MCF6427275.1 hypothetical protein [Amycolatopsis tucumanensis]